jgi:Tfp pilus assembly protein PilN
VTLTTITAGEGSLDIEGVAPNADKIFAYLRGLEASGEFPQITIVDIKRTSDGNMTFSLALKTGELN